LGLPFEGRQGKKDGCLALFLTVAGSVITDAKIPAYVLVKIKLSVFKKRLIKCFILRNTFYLPALSDINRTYLLAHFILYDSFFEPLKYIIDIPLEAFATFYKLPTYSKKTQILYRLRLLSIPFLQLTTILKPKSK